MGGRECCNVPAGCPVSLAVLLSLFCHFYRSQDSINEEALLASQGSTTDHDYFAVNNQLLLSTNQISPVLGSMPTSQLLNPRVPPAGCSQSMVVASAPTSVIQASSSRTAPSAMSSAPASSLRTAQQEPAPAAVHQQLLTAAGLPLLQLAQPASPPSQVIFGLSAVPSFILKKVSGGGFVDLRAFQPASLAALRTVNTESAFVAAVDKLPEVSTINEWNQCWAAYMCAAEHVAPHLLPNMVSHMGFLNVVARTHKEEFARYDICGDT